MEKDKIIKILNIYVIEDISQLIYKYQYCTIAVALNLCLLEFRREYATLFKCTETHNVIEVNFNLENFNDYRIIDKRLIYLFNLLKCTTKYDDEYYCVEYNRIIINIKNKLRLNCVYKPNLFSNFERRKMDIDFIEYFYNIYDNEFVIKIYFERNNNNNFYGYMWDYFKYCGFD